MTDEQRLMEEEANLIAEELLMPKPIIRGFVEQGLTPEEMAREFNVAPSFVVIRLLRLYPDMALT